MFSRCCIVMCSSVNHSQRIVAPELLSLCKITLECIRVCFYLPDPKLLLRVPCLYTYSDGFCHPNVFSIFFPFFSFLLLTEYIKDRGASQIYKRNFSSSSCSILLDCLVLSMNAIEITWFCMKFREDYHSVKVLGVLHLLKIGSYSLKCLELVAVVIVRT